MSSKSDRDNRSNQLNPNNSAYQSSRGQNEYDDNGDESPRLCELADFFRPTISVDAKVKIVFFAGLVNFDGDSFLVRFQIVTECWCASSYQDNYNAAVMNAEDISEEVLRVIKNEFEFIWSSPIAFSTIFDENGNQFIRMTDEYAPGSNPAGSLRTDRLSAESIKEKVRTVREIVLKANDHNIADWGVFDVARVGCFPDQHRERISELMLSGLICRKPNIGSAY